MPRPRTANTTRSHHKKPAPAAPELEAMVDTLVDDGANPEEVKRPAPRQQKAGPKKVLSETTRIVGDGLAIGVMLATSQADTRKNLTMEEAQSIGHPVIRMLGRRIPGWLKPFLPKTKLNPEDAADIEEILATLGKWGMRLVTIVVQDFIENREKAQAQRQQQKAGQEEMARMARNVDPEWAKMSAMSDAAQQSRAQATQAQTAQANGHNPAQDAFRALAGIDYGTVEG